MVALYNNKSSLIFIGLAFMDSCILFVCCVAVI